MARTPEKAELVSARDFAAHVQKAADLASSKLGLQTAAALHLGRWDLYGRILRTPAEGEQFAAEASKSLDKSAGQVETAVLMVDKRIFAGFFPVAKALDVRTL